MTRTRLSIFAAVVAASAATILSARPAFAGPPLLCFPFNIGQARTLPMGPNGWRSTDPIYDASHLIGDTMALLGADTPIIVRMETLRRATVYAGVNPKTGYALLSALEARAKTATPDAALSMFDLGYLVETYRQAALMFGAGVLPSVDQIDGYGLVQKAMTFRQDPQIEFAAAVIASSPRRPEYAAHLRHAEAASKADALLASNLTTRFQQP
jgi:hypothetical protein